MPDSFIFRVLVVLLLSSAALGGTVGGAEPEGAPTQSTPSLVDNESAKAERLANDLYEGDFSARQRATRELLQEGNAAINTAIAIALSADPEVRQRGEYLLSRFTLQNSRQTRKKIQSGLLEVSEKRPEDAAQAKQISKQLQTLSIRSAIQEIERNGGTVRDRRDQEETKVGPFAVSIGKSWRGEEKDFETIADLEEVNYLSMNQSILSDRGIEYLLGIPKLEILDMRATRVTGTGLAKLPASMNLERLGISYLPIKDDDLKNLAPFSNLTYLDLTETHITDAGLVHLKKYKTLQMLFLSQNSITAAAMPRLADLEELQQLELSRTKVTGPQLASLKVLPRLSVLTLKGVPLEPTTLSYLAGFPALGKLDLDSTPVTDDQLVHLKHLPSLHELSLSRTKVTDKAVTHLKGLKKLRSLTLHASGFTEIGKRELEKALPECNIQM